LLACLLSLVLYALVSRLMQLACDDCRRFARWPCVSACHCISHCTLKPYASNNSVMRFDWLASIGCRIVCLPTHQSCCAIRRAVSSAVLVVVLAVTCCGCAARGFGSALQDCLYYCTVATTVLGDIGMPTLDTHTTNRSVD
jgi:hypothetical protein